MIKIPAVCAVDFETKKIQRRPLYPPTPVSVSIRKPGEKKSKAYMWGLPSGNNCTFEEGRAALQSVWYDKRWELLFHYDKFDSDVAVAKFGLKMPSWERLHDTLFLAVLNEPHEELGLKPSAERLLGWAPDERDAVVDWLKEHRPNIRELKGNGKTKEDWSAYISEVPGEIVGPYQNGDTDRTVALFNHLYPIIVQRGMLDAYNRERRVMPILLRNEQEGVHTDFNLLSHDLEMYTAALERADNWLRKRLKSPSLNIDSDADVAEAFTRCNLVDDDKWVLTSTGKRSVSKANLTPGMLNDWKVAQVFGYRNKLQTCVNTFMLPWHRQAAVTPQHTIHTDWSQVRNTDRNSGAATLRQSSSPNFQNIPTDFEGKDGLDSARLAKVLDVPALPLMRSYLVPDTTKSMWGKCDYSQQELRILDYYCLMQFGEEGSIGYRANPKLDVHSIVRKEVLAAGLNFTRNDLKRHVVFKKIYGGGAPAICAGLGCVKPVADKIVAAMLRALPGYKALEKAFKEAGRNGEEIVTWGGRGYFVEPPRFVKAYNRYTTFEYKLLNYAIQGSAADITKEAMIRYDAHPKRQARLLLTVHDEMDISIPPGRTKQELAILKECMESVEIDPPMISEPAFGPRWSQLKEAH